VGAVVAHEAIEYGLMEAGSLGTERTDDAESTRVTGYFAGPQTTSDIERLLFEALRIYDLPRSSFHSVSVGEIENRDWLEEWKKSWQPTQVGRFIIAPPWLSEPGAIATGSIDAIRSHDPVASCTPREMLAWGPRTALGTDTIVIRINPGMAFGTGTHETTRLCLKAIEKHYRGGSFLDVGTGTGILAIAAAKMCQKPDRQGGQLSIIACDNDADAVQIAKENAGLNDVADQIDFRAGSVDDQTQSADLVCANLTAPVIAELLPALIGATCGRLILSGILDSQIEMVRSRLLELGLVDFEIDQDGEWVSITA
jgi:ribosomal protein L11 methyltransferase